MSENEDSRFCTDTVFRAESSLLPTIAKCICDDSELRLIISSLVLKEPNERLVADPKLYAIYLLSEKIMAYEEFCEGGPMGIL